MECRRQTDSTPACLVIPARRFTPVPAREFSGVARTAPSASAYVRHLGARPLQGREPSRIETVPFGRTLAGVAGRELLATHVLGNRSTEMRDACLILTPNGNFYYCLFCTLDPGAKPRPDIEYRKADICARPARHAYAVRCDPPATAVRRRRSTGLRVMEIPVRMRQTCMQRAGRESLPGFQTSPQPRCPGASVRVLERRGRAECFERA